MLAKIISFALGFLNFSVIMSDPKKRPKNRIQANQIHKLFNICFCNFPLRWELTTEKWIYQHQKSNFSNYYILFGCYKVLLILAALSQLTWMIKQKMTITIFYLGAAVLEIAGLLVAVSTDIIYYFHGAELVLAINWANRKQHDYLQKTLISKFISV